MLRAALGGPVPIESGDPEGRPDAAGRRRPGHHAARRPSAVLRPRAEPEHSPAVLGDALAAGIHAICASWAAARADHVELVVLDWLRELIGLPEGRRGAGRPAGRSRRSPALVAARHEVGGGVAYVSDQTHASIRRGLRRVGFDHVRVLATDAAFRLPATAVARRSPPTGGRPGARSSWPPPARRTPARWTRSATSPRSAPRAGLWLHVDGAYGVPAALAPRPGAARRARRRGLGQARPAQVAVPALRMRLPARAPPPGALERTFAMSPEYLRDVHRRRQLPRPRPAAQPRLARGEALADLQGLRRRGGPRGHRAGHRARRARRGMPGGDARLGGRHARPAGDRHLRPPEGDDARTRRWPRRPWRTATPRPARPCCAAARSSPLTINPRTTETRSRRDRRPAGSPASTRSAGPRPKVRTEGRGVEPRGRRGHDRSRPECHPAWRNQAVRPRSLRSKRLIIGGY